MHIYGAYIVLLFVDYASLLPATIQSFRMLIVVVADRQQQPAECHHSSCCVPAG
jgi:hypothetical protein